MIYSRQHTDCLLNLQRFPRAIIFAGNSDDANIAKKRLQPCFHGFQNLSLFPIDSFPHLLLTLDDLFTDALCPRYSRVPDTLLLLPYR